MIATSSAPTLCEGTVYHRRLRPVHHSFSYRVFYLRIPLAKMGQLPNRWLSRDRFNLLSFMSRDYGPRDGTDFAAWVRARLCDAGLSPIEGDIVLQTFPRVLGYVFNPISLWFVHDHTQALRAVIAEVSNTFGERHNYVIAHPDGAPILGTDCLVAQKLLHVSPFCEVKGHYRFRFSAQDGHWTTVVDYYAGPLVSDRLLATHITGVPRPLTAKNTLWAFLRFPLFTFAVMARIHWQALRLWLKRVPWFAKPAPPSTETSR